MKKKLFKAFVCDKLDSNIRLKSKELERPVLKKNEHRIKILSCGINYPDLLMLQGKYQYKPILPFIPGMEISGKVIESFNKKSKFTGKKIIAQLRNGGFAEETIVKKTQLFPFPLGFTNDEAAAYSIIAQTAYVALVEKAKIKKNEYVLISGSSGGVGHAAIQLAKYNKCKVIAIVSSTQKLAFVSAIGADYALVYDENLKKKIMHLTKEKGVDVIYDPIGGSYLTTFITCAAFGARVLIIGFVSKKFTKILSNYILIKGLSVIGIRAGEYLRKKPQYRTRIIKNINDLAKKKIIVPRIFKSFSFNNANNALKLLKTRKVLGKIVLKINNK